MTKSANLPLMLLALSQLGFAAELPTAGSQQQQIPPSPVPQRTPSGIEVAPANTKTNAPADDARIEVKRLHISGAKAFTENQLLAVSGFVQNTSLSLTDLRAFAARITDYYHQHGYFVAQAYLPVQDIKDGSVTIAVIDGEYGKIILRNQSGLSDDLANSLLSGLHTGDPITSAPLESRLLLLSDLPGVTVKSTLVPGATTGVSDLLVDVMPSKSITGSIDADNAGNRYTGAYRLGATVNLNNPSGHGDVASLRVLTSGSGLNYARISYQTQIGKARVGVAYSDLRYQLGREFAPLRANGTAQVASVFGSYPLIRSRDSNLNGHLGYDDKKFRDRIDSVPSVADKKVHVLTAGISGDHSDRLGAGGVTTFALSASSGLLDLQTPAKRDEDAATAKSNGHYNKLAFSAARLQNITDTLSLYGAISGQLASKNLDISEKMELGGMYGVRAYPEGEGYADQGYLLTLEARQLLPKIVPTMPGNMQLIGFVDSGSVTINKNPWTADRNHRTLSGAGVGLNWTDNSSFSVRALYAHKLGSEAATSAPDKSGRFWIQAVKYF